MAMRRPVHFVLNDRENLFRHFGARVVIDAGRVDIQNFFPKYLFRRAYVADTRQQLIEIIAAACLLQAFVIQSKTLDQIFTQTLRRPNTKLRAAMGFDSVADRDDDIEVVIVDLIGFVVGGSCCIICNN